MLLSVSLVRKADKWTFHRGVSLNFQTFERIGIPGLPIVWNSRFYASIKIFGGAVGSWFSQSRETVQWRWLNQTRLFPWPYFPCIRPTATELESTQRLTPTFIWKTDSQTLADKAAMAAKRLYKQSWDVTHSTGTTLYCEHSGSSVRTTSSAVSRPTTRPLPPSPRATHPTSYF